MTAQDAFAVSGMAKNVYDEGLKIWERAAADLVKMENEWYSNYNEIYNEGVGAWALEGKNQGQGRGFPFDQPYLVFYQRLVTVYTLLGQFSQAGLFKSKKEKKLYITIRRDLQVVTRDSVLEKTSAKMLEKVDVFNRLRSAMRITLLGKQTWFE